MLAKLAWKVCLLGCLLVNFVGVLLLAFSAVNLQRESRAAAVEESRRVDGVALAMKSCISPRIGTKTSSWPMGKAERSCTYGYVFQRGACVQCLPGKFSMPHWVACQPLLECEQIEHEVTSFNLLHSLVHWRYYRADWKGHEVIYATFNALAKTSINYSELQLVGPSQHILYPIGSCSTKSIVVFASNWTFLGTGNGHGLVFAQHPDCNHCIVKLHLVTSYLRVLVRLHSVNIVLCNSRTLLHLLSQFLVTDSFSLVLTALDNLRRDTDGALLCHHREIANDFVAPEQKWPYGDTKIFNLEEQPKYDRRTDIWKVPEVVSGFLSTCEEIMDLLEAIHLQCKATDPQLRPTAAQLLQEYEYVWDLLYKDVVLL